LRRQGRESTAEVLRLLQMKRYRNMIKKYHPDVHTDKKSSYKHMLLINYHYQVLLSYLNKAE
jgi:DnaJ-class molecular chaperone